MGVCENCGNDYRDTFKIQIAGGSHEFDCFECAIHALAPECEHCETKIIGHGVQEDDRIFCSAHCARAEGRMHVRDNASTAPLV